MLSAKDIKVSSLDKDLPALPPAATQQSWLSIFQQNVAAPVSSTSLPSPGAQVENTAQLAYCNRLLRKHSSRSLTDCTLDKVFDPSQQVLLDTLLKSRDEQERICWLVSRVVEEFVADPFKNSMAISEVVLLGPSLDREHHRKLLSCLIAEFQNSTLLDIDLLQGLVEMVQCASEPDYLLSDDLVRILVVFRERLQATHQQSPEHIYYLVLALSRLLDVMVDGKVQDIKRVVDHEPLSALLGSLSKNDDPYLKHQGTYTLQGLLHVPNDESRRQFVLRHAGNIVMGILGVASVCKLDTSGFSEGVSQIYQTTVDAVEIGEKVVGGARSILESGQGVWESAKRGLFSGGRQLWYTALREAQEHIRYGRLAEFNRLVFEAPCSRDVEFQWGICLLVAEIAIDIRWDLNVRQLAVDFLAELYRNDTLWKPHVELSCMILNLLHQISAFPETTISNRTQSLLQGLKEERIFDKHSCCREHLARSLIPYPMKAALAASLSSPLLMRVQAIPDVEYALYRLKLQQLEQRLTDVYIPPQAKPSMQAQDGALFPLLEKVQEFLTSRRQVMLLLGDSGAGKSTFNRHLEHTLWKAYKKYGSIPLHINLPTIDRPDQDLIEKQLHFYNFTADQIQELKQHRHFVVICDGYDESQLKTNLHSTNQWNRSGQWKVKAIISCRSQFLGAGYRSRFQPQAADHYDLTMSTTELFEEAVIAPFSRSQIQQYVEQYVKGLPACDPLLGRSAWTKDDYMDKLLNIPNLMDLVSNPFLLTLSLEALPLVVGSKKDLSSIRISRIELYDNFVQQWLKVNKARLESNPLSDSERLELDLLLEDKFFNHGIRFQKALARAIFKEQAGHPVVQYTHLRDAHTWKSEFFHPQGQIKLLREASTVTRTGNFFRFIHRSLLEYFYSRVFYEPSNHDIDDDASADQPPIVALKTDLNSQNLAGESSVLQFLAERVHHDISFQQKLCNIIEASKTDDQAVVAAANAITILVKAGIRFNGIDLRGVKITGADLRGGQFDSADFEGADLTKVNLGKAWLRQANFSHCRMESVQFGEFPYLDLGNIVVRCVFTADRAYLVVATVYSRIHLFDTTTWSQIAEYAGGDVMAASPESTEIAVGITDGAVQLSDILKGTARLVLSGHTGRVAWIAYSPDGARIATASEDTTVRIWSTSTGSTTLVLRGHTRAVTGVAFSPTGLHIATCSHDETVRIWNAETAESFLTLEGGHTFVAYSPNGRQIASGGGATCVLLWDAQTGERCHILVHSRMLIGAAYSPGGHQLASWGYENMIHLWNPQIGERHMSLSGHQHEVMCAEFSPIDDYIASGGVDGMVRLWKASGGRGSLGDEVSNGDITRLLCVDISPDGSQILTGNDYGYIHLWNTLTGERDVILERHGGFVSEARFSPCGRIVASASIDLTVRLWSVEGGEPVRVLQDPGGGLRCVVFSPCGGGHLLATASLDGSIRIWNRNTGKVEVEVGCSELRHTKMANCLVYSPSGNQLASSSDDLTVRVWCTASGQQLAMLEHSEKLRQLAFSPDGEYLVAASHGTGPLRCWNVQPDSLGQSAVDRFDNVSQHIYSFTFSHDGRFLVTVCRDDILRLWDLSSSSSGECTEVLRTRVGDAERMEWRTHKPIGSKERVVLATIGGARSLRVWELIELKESGESFGGGVGRFELRLMWGTRLGTLFMAEANVTGVEGLDPGNRALIHQRR